MTIFSKIISREIPADIVFENDQVLAFRDVAPQAPVHILVIPKNPVVSIADPTASSKLLGAVFSTAVTVAKQEGLEEGGYRLVTNVGSHGGQTVNHLHVHILGGRPMMWPPG